MPPDHPCNACGNPGRPISRKTVLLMLKPGLLNCAQADYQFCATRNCAVVYFDRTGNHFQTDDLRVRVGIKEHDDPIPLCYCFGFNESHLREFIADAGKTDVAQQIAALIGEGLCACESLNPAGTCCLGEVNRAMKRLREEFEALSIHQS